MQMIHMRKQIPMFVNITIFTCEFEYIEWLCIFIFGMIYPDTTSPQAGDVGKIRYNDPELFKNMSKSMMSQRLKFDHLAMFCPLKWMNGSDCQLGAHRNQIMENAEWNMKSTIDLPFSKEA